MSPARLPFPAGAAVEVVLAIDVGGTKFAAGLVGSDGEVLVADRVPTPPGGDAAALWKTLTTLVDSVLDRWPQAVVTGVGAGCGGPMTWPDGVVSPLNMPGWQAFPLRAMLAARFPGMPVRVHNDAICLAAAEHWRGAGRGSADMLGMVVSTGVGGGLILGGRLIDGGTGNAGHIGHVVVDPEGPECRCGGRGCLEAVARGPGLAAWALAQGWTPGAGNSSGSGDTSGTGNIQDAGSIPGVGHTSGTGDAPAIGDAPRAGTTPSAGDTPGGEPYVEATAASGRQLAADAAAGDEIALRALTRAGRALGIAIASATHLCDLDIVTVGGGLSQSGPLLFDPLEQALRAHARMDFARRLRVVPARLGQDAGLIGAAALLHAAAHYWTAPPQDAP
ncbi:ROK family protein [Sphaerisporangium sp. TRM90804]|uniref:ROK family protein n=1 Tax=Sphaerisporangium sp. TRM90804 TaxID=3031113 RepID=UPI00244D1C37|nr:ROK family protein [Sphaerisporangium sp. TRM90804]MDH2428789.1 ROK family protein [Sphaerisporangium sp. TRM90804]